MFTAIIRARPHSLALAATLAPLVRGVVQGLVGSAILVAEQDHPDLQEIADSAGCRVLLAPTWAEGFARAVAQASGSPVLVLDTGLLLAQDFWPLLADRLPMMGDRPAATRPAAGKGALLPLRRFIGRMNGRLDAGSAVLLTGARARAIAQRKDDPWLVPHGTDLLVLPSTGLRFEA